MNEPFVVEPTVMKDSTDCLICCLRMLLGVGYAEIMSVLPKRCRGKVPRDGISITQAANIAKKLGFSVAYHDEDFNPDYVGILDVVRKHDENEGHAVLYMMGVVYNPADNLLFTDLETFLTRGQWKVNGFLFRRTNADR